MGRLVQYRLRRTARRSIALTIGNDGLKVMAPLRATLREIESMLLNHADWVDKKLSERECRSLNNALSLHDGITLPVLGEPCTLRLQSGPPCFYWVEGGLILQQSMDVTKEQTATLLQCALRERAQGLFSSRMQEFCKKFDLVPPMLRLSNAKTRWGSCSTKSGLRLNWRLIHAPLSLIDYVLAHELAHLKEMNHSSFFWAEVGRLYPDYAAARAQLRHFSAHVPYFIGG